MDAVVRALQSFNGSIILIMGGRDKGGDYSPLESLVAELNPYGQTKTSIVLSSSFVKRGIKVSDV